LRCCICDFVFVSFMHSCIARVAGLLSDLAVCQTKTHDYCLIVAAACLRAALHSTCVCVDRLTTHTVNIGNTRESRVNIQSDRTTEDCETFRGSRRHVPTYNWEASFLVPDFTSIRHADRSHYGCRYVESLTVEGAALRSSLRRNVSVNWKASATSVTGVCYNEVSSSWGSSTRFPPPTL